MVDKGLIRACTSDNRKAHKKLYDTCAPYVYTIIKNYLTDHEVRRDVMQEVFAGIFSSLGSFNENKGAFKGWISRITVNKCIDQLKQHSKLGMSYNLEIVKNMTEDPFYYLNELSKLEIEQLLTKMPIGYKTIFLLNVIDGYNHTEISEMLNISKVTSRSQLSRSLRWIKKNISKNNNSILYEAL